MSDIVLDITEFLQTSFQELWNVKQQWEKQGREEVRDHSLTGTLGHFYELTLQSRPQKFRFRLGNVYMECKRTQLLWSYRLVSSQSSGRNWENVIFHSKNCKGRFQLIFLGKGCWSKIFLIGLIRPNLEGQNFFTDPISHYIFSAVSVVSERCLEVVQGLRVLFGVISLGIQYNGDFYLFYFGLSFITGLGLYFPSDLYKTGRHTARNLSVARAIVRNVVQDIAIFWPECSNM